MLDISTLKILSISWSFIEKVFLRVQKLATHLWKIGCPSPRIDGDARVHKVEYWWPHPKSETCIVKKNHDVRGHSTTTLTESCYFCPPSPRMDTFHTLSMDKNRHPSFPSSCPRNFWMTPNKDYFWIYRVDGQWCYLLLHTSIESCSLFIVQYIKPNYSKKQCSSSSSLFT